MHEDDAPGFWALMFWHFHGLGEQDSGRFIGQLLAARYDETALGLTPEMAALLARLEEEDRGAAPDADAETVPASRGS